MKIKILKPIRIGNVPVVKDQEVDVEDSAGKIYIKKGYAEASKGESKKEETKNVESKKEEPKKEEAKK